MLNIKRNSLKALFSLFAVITLFSSCKVYKPAQVDGDAVTYDNKEVYMQFVDSPTEIYKLDDFKSVNNGFEATLNSDFEKMNTKTSVIIWKKEIGDFKEKNNQKVRVSSSEIDSVEEYKYSKKGSVLQTGGVIVAAGLVALIVYLTTL